MSQCLARQPAASADACRGTNPADFSNRRSAFVCMIWCCRYRLLGRSSSFDGGWTLSATGKAQSGRSAGMSDNRQGADEQHTKRFCA